MTDKSDHKDGWVMYNAAGDVIGYGTGHCECRDGEYIEHSDAPEDEPAAVGAKNIQDAHEQIYAINAEDRSVVFEAKYKTAKAFLTNVPVSSPVDQNTIDEDIYTELYDEYWTTYDLVTWSPWELAQAIIDRYEASVSLSMKEATRRRAKLLAEANLPQ